MSDTVVSLHEHALAYYDLGLSVVPLHAVKDGKCSCGSPTCGKPGKHPRVRWRTLQNNPLTRQQIDNYWQEHPDSNVGVITGVRSGIAVLDIDGPEGIASLESHGLPLTDLPATPTVITGGGGLHLYFRMPENRASVKTKAGVLPKVDIRADGGLTVLPPSMHASGRRYAWKPGASLDVDFADFDFSLLSAEQREPVGRDRQYWYERLLAGVSAGGRNDAAARLAGRYLGLGLSEAEVFFLLRGWNAYNDPPMPFDELRRTVRSIRDAEQAKNEATADLLSTVSDILRIKLNRVRRITGDAPKVILEFDEGTAMMTTAQLLSPRSFQQAVAEATKTVLRRFSSRTVPTHDRLSQMILAVSEDVDAGDEATGVGELILMISDYVSSHSVLQTFPADAVPTRGPFVCEGRVWIGVTDLIQRAGIRWGTRPSLASTAQMMRAVGMLRKTFTSVEGSTRTMWGIETDRVPFSQQDTQPARAEEITMTAAGPN